ncbi:MAG: hypothetical protein V1721_01825 [Pseudomonadota bacterium]
MVAEFKIGSGVVIGVAKYIWRLIPTVMNYACRPKASIEVKRQNIVVRDVNGTESHICYPCILLSFKKDVRIDVRSIKLNNETLTNIFGTDPIYLNQKNTGTNKVTITNNRLMPFVSDNWQQLTQQACYFDVKKFDQEAIPFCTERANLLFSYKKEPKVFCAKKKLVISLCVEDHTYEYALPILDVCKVVINGGFPIQT